MEHSEIKLMLEAYAIDALDTEEACEVKTHLESGCGDCLEHLRELEELAAHLPLSVEQYSPPPELKNTIMSNIGNRPLHMKSEKANPSMGTLIAFAIAATFAIIFGVRLIVLRLEIVDLKVDIVRLESEKSKIDGIFATSIKESELLQETLVELVSDQARLKSIILNSSTEQSVLSQNLIDAKQENGKIHAQLSKAEAHVAQLEKSLEDSKNTVASLGEKLKNTKQKNRNFHAELATVEAKFARLEDSLKNSKNAIASLSETLKETADIAELFSTPETQFINLAGVEPNPQAFGKVVLDPIDGNAIVYMYRLPEPPGCMEYQLWVLRDGQPTSAGVFKVGKDGSKTIELKDITDSETIASFSVTIEPSGGLAAPTGMLYLTGP